MPIDVETCENIESKIYRIQRQNLPEDAVKSTGETLQDITKITNAAEPREVAVKITGNPVKITGSEMYDIYSHIPRRSTREFDWEE